MRDLAYSLKDFHADMIACFPELRLYIPTTETDTTMSSKRSNTATSLHRRSMISSDRSGEDEYRRTIGALFNVYWFARLDLDGKAGLCFGVDDEWRPPTLDMITLLQKSTEADHKRQAALLTHLDWSRIHAVVVDAGLLTVNAAMGETAVDVERMVAMLALTAVHDIMKICEPCPVVLPEHAPYADHAAGEVIVDHDLALGYVLLHDVEALPCIAMLQPHQQAAVRFTQAQMEYNHGWLVQAEAPPGALLSKLKALIQKEGATTADIAFYFVHWLTDLGGAVPTPLHGAEQFTLRFPLVVLSSIVDTLNVVQRLVNVSETELMEAYLVHMWRERTGTLRAEPPTGRDAIALMRLVVQVQSHLSGIQTVNAFAALSDADRATIGMEMALTGIRGQAYERSTYHGGPAILVYYSP
jgi:hypothetical protein